jgi:tRNA threonylcarbamoyladenosine biosynthesis protein TsaB
MRILAFDTSTAIASVAVVCDGYTLVQTDTCVQAKHGEMLLPRIDAALKQTQLIFMDIDLIAVGIGPGSFTGIRVALATAKGFVIASGKPFIGVNSLRVLARGAAYGPSLIGTIIDAYRGKVYQAAYRADASGRLNEILPPMHAPPKQAAEQLRLLSQGAPVRICGSGARRYTQDYIDIYGGSLEFLDSSADRIHATHLASEAEVLFRKHGPSDLTSTEPLYVKPSDAVLPKHALKT